MPKLSQELISIKEKSFLNFITKTKKKTKIKMLGELRSKAENGRSRDTKTSTKSYEPTQDIHFKYIQIHEYN